MSDKERCTGWVERDERCGGCGKPGCPTGAVPPPVPRWEDLDEADRASEVALRAFPLCPAGLHPLDEPDAFCWPCHDARTARQRIIDALDVYHDAEYHPERGMAGFAYLRFCPTETPAHRHGISLGGFRPALDDRGRPVPESAARCKESAADYLLAAFAALGGSWDTPEGAKTAPGAQEVANPAPRGCVYCRCPACRADHAKEGT